MQLNFAKKITFQTDDTHLNCKRVSVEVKKLKKLFLSKLLGNT